jgi:hypothetical protein
MSTFSEKGQDSQKGQDFQILSFFREVPDLLRKR